MERRVKEGSYRSEAAGHLLAELHKSADDFYKGWITATEMRSRLASIRRAKQLVERSDLNVLVVIIDKMKLEYESSCEVTR